MAVERPDTDAGLPGNLAHRHVHALGEVADVHELFALECVHDLLVELRVDLAAVQHRTLAALGRRHDAEEELAQGPAREVRALVVEQDHLVGRLRCGATLPEEEHNSE